ncbi:MAG: S41 family peptidase, partial [Chitinophagaceae bacterium]
KKNVKQVRQIKRNFLQDYLDFMQMTSPVVSKLIDGNIGYVYFSNINAKNMDSAMNAVINTKAIIFDMRNYPAEGYVTYYIPGYFLSEQKIYARNTYPNFDLPGMFKYIPANEGTNVSTVGKDSLKRYNGKIILLVDHRTQSAAEWACMTMMTADKVTVIGNQTAGADGNVTRTILPGSYNINFSGLGIYFPNGAETQRTGIPIDIEVKYKIEDIVNNVDPVLNSAIKYANSN